jgi:hypothetical protein
MRKHDECNNIGGVMISVLAASLWDRTPAGQTKSYKIDIKMVLYMLGLRK